MTFASVFFNSILNGIAVCTFYKVIDLIIKMREASQNPEVTIDLHEGHLFLGEFGSVILDNCSDGQYFVKIKLMRPLPSKLGYLDHVLRLDPQTLSEDDRDVIFDSIKKNGFKIVGRNGVSKSGDTTYIELRPYDRVPGVLRMRVDEVVRRGKYTRSDVFKLLDLEEATRAICTKSLLQSQQDAAKLRRLLAETEDLGQSHVIDTPISDVPLSTD